MIRLLLIAALAWANAAAADDFYAVVRYECRQSDRLIVSYTGEYDRAMVENAGPDAWSTDDLVIFDRETERRTGHKMIRRECALSSGIYRISIEGFFWNADPAGNCGYRTTALLRIERGGESFYHGPIEAPRHKAQGIRTVVVGARRGSVAAAP